MSATLAGIKREKMGSRPARLLRAQGRIPASIQGEGRESLNVSIDEDEFLSARRHHQHLFDIDFGGPEPETALVRELQWDVVAERIIHVEFRRVIRGVETEAEVELDFVGHPQGGVLQPILQTLLIRALPTAIPDSIEVNVDHLEPHVPLLVKDIELPEGITSAVRGETQVASVTIPRAEASTEIEGEGEGEEAEGEAAPEAPAEDAEPAS